MASFQILTRGMPARPDEWLHAQEVPEPELPQLTDDDRRRARIRHMSDEQYARHLLLRQTARQRELEEASQIGEVIERLFDEWKAGFRLKGIVKRGFEPGWRALIEGHSPASGWKFYDLQLPTESFSDERHQEILNPANPEEIREYLISKLGRDEFRTVTS
jgi:hypothetical protein